ncbi:Metastasis-associated protein mta1 [Globodera pallida]|nr:Metastasis-associated protein mta1 [Globodera pallida]
MAQNMYRVGDYVYFETFTAAPFQIRRIEELNKTLSGAVETKVTCFFRRRDLPNSLLKIADQAERQNKILSKPRKTLLGKVEPTSSIDANGVQGPSENGAESGIKLTTEDEEDLRRESDGPAEDGRSNSVGFAGLPAGAERLDTTELNRLRQHELFLSRIVETLPATQIRGKCSVVILNEVETCDMYLNQEDSFFYSLVYDPANQTLLADKGRIEIGERHQAKIPELIADREEDKCVGEAIKDVKSEDDDESTEAAGRGRTGGVRHSDREFVVYHPHHDLCDRDIDQFLIIARPVARITHNWPTAASFSAVGIFSRALDSSSSTKLTTLHQTASAASRDITLLHAMALLHQANYSLGQATKFLVPPPDKLHYPLEADKVTAHNTVSLGGPILCRDQLEEWSAAESTLFEDAIEKYGKDFHDIRLDCLPWKSMRDIVEYYYMWKTSSRYAELKKTKHADQALPTSENKLKQVYIPTYNKPSTHIIGVQSQQTTNSCESCKTEESTHWYHWGPTHLQFRLCGDCWTVWKKKGGLKRPHEFDIFDLDGSTDVRSSTASAANRLGVGRNGLPQSALKGSGTQTLPGQKGRVAFYLNSALEARVARRLAPKQIFNVRKAARSPFIEIDAKVLQDYYFGRSLVDVLHTAHQIKRGTVSKLAEIHLTKLHEKRGLVGPGMAQNGGNRRS